MPRSRSRSKRKSRRNKRRSRRFGTKKSCSDSNFVSGLVSSVATGLALKLPDIIKDYSSAKIKFDFDKKVDKLNDTIALLEKSDTINKNLINQLKASSKEWRNEALEFGVNTDKLDHLMRLLRKYPDIPASHILDIHENYPDDL